MPLQEDTPFRAIEVKESLIEIFVDLYVKPTIELLPSSPAMRALLSLRLPDIYNPLQIFLQQICSQKIKLLMQSTIGPVFGGDDLSRHAAYILLELPSIAASLS